jgi:ankyrin repeat protein
LKAAVQLFSSSRVAAGGHKTVVQALLETSKVDLNAKDRTGQTPLSWTSAGGYERVVQMLLATCKVDPHAKDHGEKLPGHE